LPHGHPLAPGAQLENQEQSRQPLEAQVQLWPFDDTWVPSM
jgi:hypothetical protein